MQSKLSLSPVFLTADVGNARIKLGLFARSSSSGLPEPLRTLPLLGDSPELDSIEPWLTGDAPERLRTGIRMSGGLAPFSSDENGTVPFGYALTWWIASVNRPAAGRLIDWLREHRPGDRVVLLSAGDLPLEVRLARPDMVGIDRLIDAVAVNRLRAAGRAAAIVDVGSAITVDLLSADGAFLGGSILPGLQMSARAMHEFTDLLPLIHFAELAAPPPALGVDTASAMRSGLFWGAVGAIRQLIEQYRQTATENDYNGLQIFLTGGAAPVVAELLGSHARYVPHLTLAGIALTAEFSAESHNL